MATEKEMATVSVKAIKEDFTPLLDAQLPAAVEQAKVSRPMRGHDHCRRRRRRRHSRLPLATPFSQAGDLTGAVEAMLLLEKRTRTVRSTAARCVLALDADLIFTATAMQ